MLTATPLTPAAAPLAMSSPRDELNPYARGDEAVYAAAARAIAPRTRRTVSQWADEERDLSAKGSQRTGRWRTSDNPLLREPMDCLSNTSAVRDVSLMFPIQLGKTEVIINALGYVMCERPGPVMVALPDEVSQKKWIAQKLNPMLEETAAVQATLASTASRDAANQRDFKDFLGGQLYIEHMGTPTRVAATSVMTLFVDELDKVSPTYITTGEDPLTMLDGRTSAFPATYKRMYVSSPRNLHNSRIFEKFMRGDQRRYYVPCPHCRELQPLEWNNLRYDKADPENTARYVCRECGAEIDESHKTWMLKDEAAGGLAKWVPGKPGARERSYTTNGLYYQLNLGPRWGTLAAMWVDAQNDPAKLKVFCNERLAEPWDDPSMRAVKHNLVQERAVPYALRTAPAEVLVGTYGIDTQDNRLALHIVGWGRGMRAWTLDYNELMGDPADADVWEELVRLMSQPILHASGAHLPLRAGLIDLGGHRREAVKAFVRSARLRGLLAGYGAKQIGAPVLGKGKAVDVNWRGQFDRRGVLEHAVGTINAKHWLFGRMATDAERPEVERLVNFSADLPPEFFAGMTSERFNPQTGRFEKSRGGVRNEPVDTWVYAYAATHAPHLRLHRYTRADWDALEVALANAAAAQRQADANADAASRAETVKQNTQHAAQEIAAAPALPKRMPPNPIAPRAFNRTGRSW